MLFTGAKPVAPATKMIGFARVLAQEERAERPFEAHRVADLHRGEDVGRELAAGDQADLQLDLAFTCGAVANEKLRFSPSRQQDVDVLAGVEADRLAVDLQLHEHHVVRCAFCIATTRAV